MSFLLVWKQKRVVVINHEATAKRARKFRKERGVSVRELAREAGLSAAYISDLELGRRNWSKSIARRWLEALQKVAHFKKTQKAITKGLLP